MNRPAASGPAWRRCSPWDGAPLTDIKVTAGLEDTVSSKGTNDISISRSLSLH